MIRHTFSHIPGIGHKHEEALWAEGYHSWESVLEEGPLPVSASLQRRIREHMAESIRSLENGDPHYFSERLPSDQHWRLFREFRDAIAYIDIETTGMGMGGDHITTIALYDGKDVYSYVWDRNLVDFRHDIKGYKVLVSFNGKCFDVPFIEKCLDLRMNQVHIDLRYVLRSLGYRGGLKSCEKQLGIDRAELDGVDGYFAVLLWREFVRNGNEKALETLLAYNVEDTVNLETLMVLAYNAKIAGTPFDEDCRIPKKELPEVPFKADLELVDSIRDFAIGV